MNSFPHNPISTAIAHAVAGEPNFRRTALAMEGAISPEFSDDALALIFARRVQANLCWTPALDWLVFDGVVWQEDENLTRMTHAREVARQESKRAKDNEKNRIASARAVAAILSLAKSDPRLVVDSDQWDSDPIMLNTPTGVVHLATGECRDRRGAEYFTQVTRVSPQDHACPIWEQFLRVVFVGDLELIEFVQRVLGYFLTGDRSAQYLFFLHGSGRNGKSVLTDLLLWIMNTYAMNWPASSLMQSKVDRHPTDQASLRGKRLALSSELDEHETFNAPLVKRLTGDSTLTARFMRGDYFQFKQTQKHCIVGNFKPRVRGGDRAMSERVLLIPFSANIPRHEIDPQMLDKLKAEAGGILRWIIDGAVAWRAGGLRIPPRVREASAEYMAEHDDLALWLDECCVRSGAASAGDLYGSFGEWKRKRGEEVPTMTAWGTRLAAVSGIDKYKSGVTRYKGVALRGGAPS